MPLINIPENLISDIHKTTIDVSGGGSYGVLDIGKLYSVVAHIENDEYYPTFIDKITHLFYCSCSFHSFVDGNKRIALSLSAQLLLLNGYVFIVGKFIKEMENISYHVAANKIDKPLLHDIIDSIINQTYDDNEELKLRILNAIE